MSARRLWQRILSIFRGRSLDAELDAEIAAHIDFAVADLEREGHSPEEARRLAHVKLGGIEASKDLHRDSRGFPLLDSLLQDIRQAIRGFARAPGFTAIAIAIMAIGIGSNAAVFTVIRPLLLRPLPFSEPERLVWMEQPAAKGDISGRTLQVAMLEDLRRENRSFEAITAYFPFVEFTAYKLTGRGEPERVQAVEVVTNFFQTLGVTPHIGRDFHPADGLFNAPPTAILSHGYWQRRFNGDPAIVGQSLTINGKAHVVTGVMGRDFDFSSIFHPTSKTDIFLPSRLDRMRNWGNVFFFIGRLKPNVTLTQARQELASLVPQLVAANRTIFSGGRSLVAMELSEYISGGLRRSLLILWAAVVTVLLVVCANLANLMLARTGARAKELAVRAALGAGKRRLARQLVTEGILLASCGALLGLPIAFVATRLLQSAATTLNIPLLYRMSLDTQATAFAFLLAIIAGAIIGLVPALRLPQATAMSNDLRDSSRAATGGHTQQRIRTALIIAEVAMAFVLLTSAGLLLRSFVKLLDVNLGFDAANAVVVPIDLPEEKDCGKPADCFWRSKGRLDEVMRRTLAIPGVETAGFTDALPLGRNRSWGLREKGKQYPPGTDTSAFVYIVSPDFFKAMGIPLLAGQGFTEEDTKLTEGVTKVVINRTAAQTLWPGQDATGRLASIGNTDAVIAGVVEDTRQSSLDTGAGFQMYLPHGPRFGLANDLVVRSRLPAAATAGSVRSAISAYDPNLVTSAYTPVQNLVDVSVSPRRFLLTLIAVFAGIALILAALGIYGVISYMVNQRVREIGIRLALGADPAALRWRVVRGTAAVTLAGIAIGVAAGAVTGRFAAPILFETSPVDPFAFGATAAVLLVVATLAGYIPALRASRVDPAIALRNE